MAKERKLIVMASWSTEEKWQVRPLKTVLDYHNELHGTDFVIVGRYEQAYPEKGRRWDWVCCDNNTGSKGAIEVKELTDEYEREVEVVLKQISDKLERQLSGGIPGSYRLLLNIRDRPLHLDQDKRGKSKKIERLERVLLKTVEDSANTGVKEELDLSAKIREQLPQIVTADFEASLLRIPSGESRLVVELMTGGSSPSVALEGNQRTKFNTLVRKANEQLRKAKAKGISETFLITLDVLSIAKAKGISDFITLSHLAADPEAIKNSFWELNPDDHCNIGYAYHVVASSVTRIKPCNL